MRRSFVLAGALIVTSMIFVCDGFVARASMNAVNDSLILAKKPARKLSDYSLFKDPAARIPNERVVSYDLINPLFTDYAQKIRYVYVPDGAGAAPYQEEEALNFPVGSVLIKTFAYPKSFKRPGRKIRFIETRLLLHKKDGWKAYPYVWNEAQTDAVLKVAGKRLEIPVVWTNGETEIISYAIPNVNQCKGCHINAQKELAPIGPKIRNLNKEHAFSSGKKGNQIRHLEILGYMEKPPKDPSDLPRVPNPFDADDGDLYSRARSYLDANCGHCHSRGRPADTSGLYLDYLEKEEIHWGVNKSPVAAGRGSGGLDVDIKPGDPDQSILYYRMKSRDPGVMMPELGRSLNHREGLELIREFISNLN